MSGWEAFWAWVAAVMASGWGVPIQIVLIVVVAILATWLAHLLIRRTVNRIVKGLRAYRTLEERRHEEADSPVPPVRRIQRARSLGRIFDNAATSVISVVAVILVIYTVWPGAATTFGLVAAGIGAGVGIGAQGLVRDVINGIFFAVEDQLGIGDVVDAGLATGVVEDLGVRITQIRDVNGTLWFIPNGQILRVGNQSHGWARAIVDLSVPYSTDVDTAKQLILTAGAELAADPDWKSRILEPPEVWGIQSIAPDAVVLRAVVKTPTGDQDDVARELRGRVKVALDKAGITVWPPTIVHLDE